MTPDEVRKATEWSLSKVVRIENGSVSVSAMDLRALLALYGVDDLQLIDEMLDLARASRRRHWASAYREWFSPAYLDFLGYEDDAQDIRLYHPDIIPGVLQTEPYARALITAMNEDQGPAAIDARVRLRTIRQRHVLDRTRAGLARLHVLIDETSLRRVIGGPREMVSQIDHVLRLGEEPETGVFVVPESVGAHPGLRGAFAMIVFDSPDDPDVVFLENAPADLGLIDSPADVQSYQRAFDKLISIARSGVAAVEILQRHRDRYLDLANRP